ncbi:MAG TPA: FliH/SctL family protein [Oscillospiraceae bacterium]|nr:FliH/SctL family protein [Oscillospiraceae bacterium]
MSSIIKGSQYDTINDPIPLIFPQNDEVEKAVQNPAPQISINPQPVNIQEQSKLILSSAFDKARQIMDAAKSYSQSQIKEATERMNQECVQMKRQSHDEGFALGMIEGKNAGKAAGYREGYEEGLQKAAEENQQAMKELSEMMEAVESSKSEILEKYAADLEKLAITIAQKVVKRELSIDEKAMQSIIRNAVDSYRNQEWVRICVSKNMEDVLLKADSSIIEALKDVSDSVKIVASPEMTDGDCIIDMPDRMIDCSADAQIRNIQEAFGA